MWRTVLVAIFLALPVGCEAWSKAGHMLTGAIAYRSMDPEVRRQIATALRSHPNYVEWRARIKQTKFPDPNLALFMYAARWPDDFREESGYSPTFDPWHYVNYAYRPPNSSPGQYPNGVNILQSYARAYSQAIHPSGQNPAQKRRNRAIALSWVFHLIGDIHQPLHTTALFSNVFQQGDRGGTRFYVIDPDIPDEDEEVVSLHQYWDDRVLKRQDENLFRVAQVAVTLLKRPELARSTFPELTEPNFNAWAIESFGHAVSTAYGYGVLPGTSSKPSAVAVLTDYRTRSLALALRRTMLSGYRLGSKLEAIAQAAP